MAHELNIALGSTRSGITVSARLVKAGAVEATVTLSERGTTGSYSNAGSIGAVAGGAYAVEFVDAAGNLVGTGGIDLATSGVEVSLSTLTLATTDPTLVHTGTAQAGAALSVTLAAAASATNELYAGQPIQISAGMGVGQVRTIVAYNGTTKVVTVDRAWQVIPDATSVYKTRALASAKLNDALQVGAFTTTSGTGASSSGSSTGQTANYAARTHYYWTQTFTLNGVDSTGWNAFVFTLKTSSADADAAALLTIKVENPADGATDGLTVFNAAPTDGTTRPYGALTIDTTGGNTVITWAVEAPAMVLSEGLYAWEVGRFKAGVPRKEPMCSGAAKLTKALLLSTAAP